MKSQVQALAEKVIRHMADKNRGHQVGGILLTGDPGTGKTSFVEILGALVGMKTVIIEVPHVSEEHLINIPFIVYNPQTNSAQTMSSQMGQDYKLVLAQSNLYTQVASATAMSDEQYLAHINKLPGYIQQIYVGMGGTQDKIPEQIIQVRKSHNVILFLDEYYRETTTRIRNVMRGILNNKIGMHSIPPSTYVIYASNMADRGLEKIHSNAQFTAINYKTPTKQQWFDYLEAKFKDSQTVQLKQEVVQAFRKALTDDDMSFTGVTGTGETIRTSPRRWEQLILYVNSSLPVSNAEQATTLLTNIKNMFVHYRTNEYSRLADKVASIVTHLIKETSNVTINPTDKLTNNNWRSMLVQLIEQQRKLGEHRKYIPVISGAPGIGKTAMVAAAAAQFNMRLIEIDISEMSPEDVIGMPLPDKKPDATNPDIRVHFSIAKLAQQIERLVEQADIDYYNELREKHGDKAEQYIKQYENQRWKYLIFFDEINRCDDKTFNALRKVILEKNFGPAGDNSGKLQRLPEGSLVIAALNPEGEGTGELTEHFRDVIDVVPAEPHWGDTKRYLNDLGKNMDPTLKQAVLNIMDAFVEKFRSKDIQRYDANSSPFHLDTGNEMYISPREYSDMFATLAREMWPEVKAALADPNIKEAELRKKINSALADAMQDSLNFIFHKHEAENFPEFGATLEDWIKQLPSTVFAGLLTRKVHVEKTIASSLTKYLSGTDLLNMPEDLDIFNTNSSVNNAQFIDGMKQILAQNITDDASAQKFIIDENHPKVVMVNDTLQYSKNEQASLLTNFVLGLLYTLHILRFQNDRISSIGRSLSVGFSELSAKLKTTQKISPEIAVEMKIPTVQLRGEINDLIQSLE